jgi:hypothetical protein
MRLAKGSHERKGQIIKSITVSSMTALDGSISYSVSNHPFLKHLSMLGQL